MSPSQLSEQSKPLALWLVVFMTVFVTYAYFFQSGQHNANARFDQVRAIVERGTLHINGLSHNTADIVKVDDHWYPNKAPGTSFLALPAWILASALLSPLELKEELFEHLVCYLTALLTSGLLSAVATVLIFFLIRRMFGDPMLAALLAVAYGLGTIAFPFATMFFSHQIAGALLVVGFSSVYFVDKYSREVAEEGGIGWLSYTAVLLGGLCLGFSVTTEYPAALGAGAITLYGLIRFGLSLKSFLLLVGGLLGGLCLLAYNLAAFGEAFFVPYSVYQAPDSSFPDHAQGLFGVTLPSWKTLLSITVRPQRGLFWVNPWLILVIPGLFTWIWSKTIRLELLMCSGIVLAFLAFNAGYGNSFVYWGGGASVGPRHIIPMLPFAVLLVAPLLRQRWVRLVLYPLLALSVLIMLAATAVEPRTPYEYSHPVKQFYWPNYLYGNFALLDAGVFNGYLLTPNSVAFNIGKLLSLPGHLQLVPLFCYWFLMGVLTIYLIRSEKSEATRSSTWKSFFVAPPTIGFFSGVFVLGAYLVMMAAPPIVYFWQSEKLKAEDRGLNGKFYREVVWDRSQVPSATGTLVPARLLVTERVLTKLVFPWEEEGMPIPGAFSAEWTGYIYAPKDGTYRFDLVSDDGSALYLNDSLIVENWGEHGARGRGGDARLSVGWHRFKLRYFNSTHGGLLKIKWRPPGAHMQLIDPEYLRLTDPEEAPAS